MCQWVKILVSLNFKHPSVKHFLISKFHKTFGLIDLILPVPRGLNSLSEGKTGCKDSAILK